MIYVAFIAVALGVLFHPEFRRTALHGLELIACMFLIFFLCGALTFGVATRDHTAHLIDANGSPAYAEVIHKKVEYDPGSTRGRIVTERPQRGYNGPAKIIHRPDCREVETATMVKTCAERRP